MTDVATSQLSFIYPKGTDELSASLRLLKKEILYILSSGSVIISIRPPALLRLILCSVWTFTRSDSVPPNIISRITPRLTVIQCYATDLAYSVMLTRRRVDGSVGIILRLARE
jgi:hypothetical protein